jgi:hypothetical protein
MRSIDSDHGPTVLLSTSEDRLGTPMVMLSVALLRKLLELARALRPSSGRRQRARLDIRV